MLFCVVVFFFLSSIPSLTSLSDQGDLAISTHSFLGCLRLKPDKEFLGEQIQDNFLLPYQTYVSPQMSIELCFRLCRRWMVLMLHNRTHCLCLHALTKPYELSPYLGEVISEDRCTTADAEIYTLTADLSLLPSLSSDYDWTLDGCYSIQGMDQARANFWLNQGTFVQAVDLCRQSCQEKPETRYYSFFISRRRGCFCLSIKWNPTAKILAVRRPLLHCSFLPQLCLNSSDGCRSITSNVNLDTVIRIGVERRCSSTNWLRFVFDRRFGVCLQTILFSSTISYGKLVDTYRCSPLAIPTIGDWNDFLRSPWLSDSFLYLRIDASSRRIFPTINQTSFSDDDLCLAVRKKRNDPTVSVDFLRCSSIRSSGYVLCAQKPLEGRIPSEEGFRMKKNESNPDNVTCPSGFLLFNEMCYFFHTSSVYNRQFAEQACENEALNSTLVKFTEHQWANIDSSKFLGRTKEDSLLEFFYYHLENKLREHSSHNYTQRHWLRMLLGDRNGTEGCVLRYFTRATGAFSTIRQCQNGGHPICQTPPIQAHFSTTQPPNTTMVPQSTTDHGKTIEITTETTTGSSTQSRIFNTTSCDNCSTHLPVEETTIANQTSSNTFLDEISESQRYKRPKYLPLVVILTGPVLGLVLLFISISLLIYYLRRNRNSYSTRSSVNGPPRRTRRSSTAVTFSDVPNTPAILYTRAKPTVETSTELDTLLAGGGESDDRIEIVSPNMTHAYSNGQDKEHLLVASH